MPGACFRLMKILAFLIAPFYSCGFAQGVSNRAEMAIPAFCNWTWDQPNSKPESGPMARKYNCALSIGQIILESPHSCKELHSRPAQKNAAMSGGREKTIYGHAAR
jgi:hypothetical protein